MVTPEQPALGVELVEQPEEVVLVGAAAVVEDQRAGRLPRRLADAEVDAEPVEAEAHAGTCRGLRTGFRFASTRSRRCS